MRSLVNVGFGGNSASGSWGWLWPVTAAHSRRPDVGYPSEAVAQSASVSDN
jgi:hypothetical protein